MNLIEKNSPLSSIKSSDNSPLIFHYSWEKAGKLFIEIRDEGWGMSKKETKDIFNLQNCFQTTFQEKN